MAQKNAEVDYEKELHAVREIYAGSNLHQRIGIVRQRLAYKDSPPNNLVNVVSAVEGFARILLCTLSASQYGDAIAAYNAHRNDKPEDMVRSILSQQGSHDPSSFFGEDTWDLFGYAVRYRHMIIHECTYLGQDKGPSMIAASREILVWLVSEAGEAGFDPDI